jgi:hypothetical protein
MAKSPAPIPFAGSERTTTRYVCAFFSSDEKECRVLLPFIKNGGECGVRVRGQSHPRRRSWPARPPLGTVVLGGHRYGQRGAKRAV